MSTLAIIVVVIAIAGAVASWIAGAVFYVRTLRAIGPDQGDLKWMAIVGWLFASKRFTGEAAVHASKVNKALVAFFVCLMVAIAAISLATNLSRISR